MSFIVVCPLSRVEEAAKKYQTREMITLMNDNTNVSRPAGIAAEHHLVLTLNDINKIIPGLVHPQESDVNKLIEKAWSWDQRAPLLIHCWMGISRSTAAAYIIAATLNPAEDEFTLAERLRSSAPFATPNKRLIALGDKILGRENRMIKAIETIGRGAEVAEGDIFTLDISESYHCN